MTCKYHVPWAIPLGQSDRLKVGFGVALAFQTGIHGAAGEQTLVWFEIAGGASTVPRFYVQKHFQILGQRKLGREEQSQPKGLCKFALEKKT